MAELAVFNWEVFKVECVGVRCKTQESARDFLRQCVERGIGVPFSIDHGFWSGEHMIYIFDRKYPEKNRVSYSHTPDERYNIYEWQYPLNHFSKSDMRDGMIVDIREGGRYMWLDGCCIEDHYFFDEINDDLTSEGFSNLDIMKVYKIKKSAPFDMIMEDINLSLIWERIEN